MLPAGLVKSKVMLCRLIFKAITGFFTLLSPCIFNNLLSNDLSPPYPPPHPSPSLPHSLLLTHSASPSVFSAPAAKCPAASLRLQSPIRPHLAVSFQQPHIRRGMRATHKKKQKRVHTHTCAPALASSRVNCIKTRVHAPATLFTVLPQTFSHSPLHFSTETGRLRREGRQRWGNAEVRLSLLSAPLRSPLVSRGSYL